MKKFAFFGMEKWEKDHVLKVLPQTIEVTFYDHILSIDNLPEKTDFDGLCVFVDSAVSAEVIDKFPNLKHIATRSTGFDHIDVAHAKEKGIIISYVPAYGENTVAEFAFALLLSLSRKIYDAYHRVKEEGRYSFDGLRGFDLKGKTIGVVGTGRIGKNSVKIASGFGMKIVAYDPYPDEKFASENNVEYMTLEKLLADSDVVTIHVPYMESTHHLINKNNIGLMKKGAILINTARGGIVETEALVSALKSGHLGGAGLDVLEEEGVIKDELHFLVSGHPEEHNMKTVLANHILIDMPNVIITPHNAFNTKEALERILNTTLDNIIGFSSGKEINNVK